MCQDMPMTDFLDSRATRLRSFSVVGAIVLAAFAAWLAGTVAGEITIDAARARVGTEARLQAALFESEVARLKLLPLLLADDTDIARALNSESGRHGELDAKLSQLARNTGAGAIYVLGPDGVAISASNAGTPSSFVGSNYAFRAYFREAKAAGSGLDYALGTVSGRPGLYLSQRTADGGVVVVKLEFDGIEREWARRSGVTLVEDPAGTVLITSDPRLRFRNDQRGSADRSRSSLLHGSQIVATVPTSIEDWRLLYSEPRDAALGAVVPVARMAGGSVVLAFLALAYIVFARRRRRAEREISRLQRTAELEAVVDARTSELRREMEERNASEAHAAELRESLRQANRLATLGQVTAGLAHETAQPVAAIRTYAANGITLSERGEAGGVRENFAAIARLADRIGRITEELRNFSRKRTGELIDVPLSEAISGALLILKERLHSVTLHTSPEIDELLVRAGRVRLEQILVNLLQNAVEALVQTEDPHIALSIARNGEMIVLTVADNGPGLSPAMTAKLFTPFATERIGGLGLGLVIARDIARDMGGDLTYRISEEGGAAFALSLRQGSTEA